MINHFDTLKLPAAVVVYKASAILEAVQKNGLKKYWQNFIVSYPANDPDTYYTMSQYWQDLKDGTKSSIQYSDPYLAEPKNIGRANETTSLQQAELEFESTIQKQRDKKKYRYAGEDRSNDRVGPILAHKYDDHKNKLSYPLFVQPKYDGNRMLYKERIGWSRGDKLYLPAVLEHLHFDTKGLTFDGEMILPNNPPLQQTASAVKKFQAGKSDTLLFWIFDIVDFTKPFVERYQMMKDWFASEVLPPNVRLVPTKLVHNEAELQEAFDEFVTQGFEGLMARNAHGMYVSDRSYDLLKYKPFIDEEFPIVDIVSRGGGSAEHLAKFILRAKNDQLFESNVNGTDAENREILTLGMEFYKGQYATVRYQTLTERGVPQFPRVINIREHGDF
jgi:DNA ligase 1